MKGSEIQIGRSYLVKVSGRVVPCRVSEKRERFTPKRPNGSDYWLCRSETTGRTITVLSAQRFRAPAE